MRHREPTKQDHRISRRMRPVRLFNLVAGAARKLGWSPIPASAESLMSIAMRKTGLINWGDAEPRLPLESLLDSFRTEGRLHPSGWFSINSMLVTHLCDQLKITEELRRFPEIRDQSIREPLFVISLPRTGTTLLHRLLACDPLHRAPMYWETAHPTPHPLPEEHHTDPRIKQARRELALLSWLLPAAQLVHPMASTEAEECNLLLARSLYSYLFTMFYGLPGYARWLDGQALENSYEYHRLQLQILQYRFADHRWVLKTPLHMLTLPAIFGTYPDALIIQTHRDPVQLVPSFCSLMAQVRGVVSDEFTPQEIGAEAMRLMDQMLRRSDEALSTVDPGRVVNVHYTDLVRQPIETVRSIYDQLGLNYTDAFEGRMRRWISDNPKNKHGVHKYSLEQFSLSAGQVREVFSDYVRRHEIPISATE